MHQNKIVVFVCEHGAAKSIIAAAYFNKLANQIYPGLHAIARGTHPDQELSPKTIIGLREDGLLPAESTPQKLSLSDIESAHSIVSFCELPEEYWNKVRTERWDDVPPVSEDYKKARDVIVAKLNQLIMHIYD
jgi:protein-tyrosine-phosphatase